MGYDIAVGEKASVAIRASFALLQHDLIAPGERIQSRRAGAPLRWSAALRRRQRRHFDRGQTDFASIPEHESAAVEDVANNATGDLPTAAGVRGLDSGWLFLGASRRSTADSRNSRDQCRCQEA